MCFFYLKRHSIQLIMHYPLLNLGTMVYVHYVVMSTVSLLTYLLSPLRARSQIRPTPMNAVLFCPLPALRPAPPPQLHPRAFIYRSTDLLHVSFGRPLLMSPVGVQRMATLGIDVGGILLTWPIHLHLLFFTSNEMSSIPVRSWSSAFVILFGQKMNRILLRYLFWNTSSTWHIPLVNSKTLQHIAV